MRSGDANYEQQSKICSGKYCRTIKLDWPKILKNQNQNLKAYNGEKCLFTIMKHLMVQQIGKEAREIVIAS